MIKRLTRLILFAVLFSTSCTDVNNVSDKELEYVDVKFSLSLEGVLMKPDGDIKSQTKSTSNDLYAVQIYKTNVSGGQLTPFGYGLFDATDKIKVKLAKDFYYKVVITCVRQGKVILTQTPTSTYDKPFDLVGSTGGVGLTNEMIISPSKSFKSLSTGESLLVGASKSYIRPACDRYYGESEEFYCDKQTSFSVDLKRVVFALDVSTANIPKGKLKVVLDGSADVLVDKDADRQIIYTFAGGKSGDWAKDDYSESVGLTLFYDSGEGRGFIQLGDARQVDFKRRYSYQVGVSDVGVSGGNITFEGEDFLGADDIIF